MSRSRIIATIQTHCSDGTTRSNFRFFLTHNIYICGRHPALSGETTSRGRYRTWHEIASRHHNRDCLLSRSSGDMNVTNPTPPHTHTHTHTARPTHTYTAAVSRAGRCVASDVVQSELDRKWRRRGRRRRYPQFIWPRYSYAPGTAVRGWSTEIVFLLQTYKRVYAVRTLKCEL